MRLLDEIRRIDPDVICLQELMSAAHAQWLHDHLGWKQSFWETGKRGWVAGGLAIFSKLPLTATSFRPFSRQAPLLGFGALSRLWGKGFMRIELGSPRTVLFHTDLIQDYGATRWTLTNYAKLQAAQAAEMTEAMRGERLAGRAIVAGCLNATPSSEVLRGLAQLRLADIMGGSEEPSTLPEDRLALRFGVRRRLARLDYILDSRSTLSYHRGLLGQMRDP